MKDKNMKEPVKLPMLQLNRSTLKAIVERGACESMNIALSAAEVEQACREFILMEFPEYRMRYVIKPNSSNVIVGLMFDADAVPPESSVAEPGKVIDFKHAVDGVIKTDKLVIPQ